MNNSNFERFTAVDSVKDRKIPSKKQKELIVKLQKDTITHKEANILIGSLYDLVIKQARKMYYKFPDRELEDLVEDGVYNLWLRLPGYDHTRAGPSTYATIVVKTAFLKELAKLKNRVATQTVFNEKTEEMQKIAIPNMSLQNFLDENGSEYEPDVLGKEDGARINTEEKIFFEEMVLEMYQNICSTIRDFRILNNILDIKKLPNFGGGRRRKSLHKVAENHGVKTTYVENLAKRVNPWLKRHDFLTFLSKNEYPTPSLLRIFKSNDIRDKFAEEEIEDVWDIIDNN